MKTLLRSAAARISAFRLVLLERFWRLLDPFPGDWALIACPLAAGAVVLLLELLWIVLTAWLGETGLWVVHLLPYLFLIAAFVVFPGGDPALERAIGLLLAFWIGGAPLATAYAVLAAAAHRGGRISGRLWHGAAWFPRKVHELLRRIRERRPPPLRPAEPLPRWAFGLLLAIALFGLYLRLAQAHAMWPPRVTGPDSREYDVLAHQLAAGRPMRLDHNVIYPAGISVSTRANRPPGYPAFLAVFYRTDPSTPQRQWAAAIYAQCVLDVIAGLLLFLALCRVLPSYAAMGACALWLTYAPAIRATTAFLPEGVSAFVLCGALCLTLSVASPLAWGASGLAAAGAAMLRPELVGLPALLAAAAIVLPAKRWTGKLWRVALLVALFLLGVAPWVVRNYHVLGHFVPTSTIGGRAFWSGNYLPFRGMIRGEGYFIEREALLRHHVDLADEVAVDHLLWREGLRNVGHYLLTQPGDYLRLLWQKVDELWEQPFWFRLGRFASPDLRPLILFFAFLGAGVALINWRLLLLLLGLPVYQTLAHVLSYGHEHRYLLPIIPMVFGLAAVGLWFAATPAAREALPPGPGDGSQPPAGGFSPSAR